MRTQQAERKGKQPRSGGFGAVCYEKVRERKNINIIMNRKNENIQVGKNFFVREICDAWRGSALGFSVRTAVLASILGSPVQGELDFCAQRAQKD